MEIKKQKYRFFCKNYKALLHLKSVSDSLGTAAATNQLIDIFQARAAASELIRAGFRGGRDFVYKRAGGIPPQRKEKQKPEIKITQKSQQQMLFVNA